MIHGVRRVSAENPLNLTPNGPIRPGAGSSHQGHQLRRSGTGASELNHLPKSLFFSQIMGTCAPNFTFFDQKRADVPNLGARNSTVTFFCWNEASKGHKKATKITSVLLKGDGARPKSKDLGIFWLGRWRSCQLRKEIFFSLQFVLMLVPPFLC